MAITNNSTYILFTVGDPCGVGPEVTLKAVSKLPENTSIKPILIGNSNIISERIHSLKRLGIGFTKEIVKVENINDVKTLPSNNIPVINIGKDKAQHSLGKPTDESGEEAIEAVLFACNILRDNPNLKLITSPMSKQAIQMGQYHRFKGHKEIFQDQFPGSEVINMIVTYPFARHPLRLVHVTSHIPLRQISSFLVSTEGKEKIFQTIKSTWKNLIRLGLRDPHIAVTGINPHLEEWEDIQSIGKLGREERISILPTVEALKSDGMKVFGPMTADSAYRNARMGKYDVVVSMFHDQSHIVANSTPNGFRSNIILSLGLPFMRLSTSHGVALDIAHNYVADSTPIEYCIKFASKSTISKLE